MPFVCSATWIAKTGSEGLVVEALSALTAESRSEPGNLIYQAYHDPDEPGTFRIFEVYADEAAFIAHADTEHFRTYALSRAIPALESRERRFYRTLDD